MEVKISADILSADKVRRWIGEGLQCSHLDVRGDGRHFEALVISEEFVGLSRVRRHQRVYAALGDKMHSAIHALSIRALAPDEWHG